MRSFQPHLRKLLDQVRNVIRTKYYSYQTEQTYVQWIYRYIMFHNKRPPKDMGVPEIEAFLTDLAVNRHVAASTQNQSLSAIALVGWVEAMKPNNLQIKACRTPTQLNSSLRDQLIYLLLLQGRSRVTFIMSKLCGNGLDAFIWIYNDST